MEKTKQIFTLILDKSSKMALLSLVFFSALTVLSCESMKIDPPHDQDNENGNQAPARTEIIPSANHYDDYSLLILKA